MPWSRIQSTWTDLVDTILSQWPETAPEEPDAESEPAEPAAEPVMEEDTP